MRALLICTFLLSLVSTIAENSSQNYTTLDNCGLLRANNAASGERKFEFKILGYDYDNVPVTVWNWGRWDFIWLVNHPTELRTMLKNMDDSIEELRQGLFFPRFTNGSETTDTYITILDFDGLDLRQLFSEAANHITELVINMAKPFAGNFLERMEVYGTKPERWIPKVLKKIPRNQLPPAYGGNVDFKPIVTCNFI